MQRTWAARSGHGRRRPGQDPWHVAKNRADKTGAVLADLLARTNENSYVLIGHRLGSRAMVVAAQTLGTNPGGPQVEAVHHLGAAIGAKSDWHTLTAAVIDKVYNYHSTNDSVLRIFYSLAQGGQTAQIVPARTSNSQRYSARSESSSTLLA